MDTPQDRMDATASVTDSARRLQEARDVDSAMRLAVALAVREIDGADAAALSIVHKRGKVDTPVASNESAQRADELQYVVGEGPCLSAVWEDLVVSVPDIYQESRWPSWSAAVQERTGFRSMLVTRLFTTNDRVGALNLYSTRAHGFDDRDLDHAEALAAHIAIAIRSAQEIAGLQVALDTRTVLGQATGMIMERYGLTAEQAYAVLARLSSHGNRKIRDLAAEITTTGTAPGLPRPADGGRTRGSSAPLEHEDDVSD